MAARTAIVTDSTCNLPPDLARERRIHVAPLYVIWGDDSLRDGIDIQEPAFYERLRAASDIPKTSQVTPQDFVTLFERVRAEEEADAIVCAVLSSDLSGTYASATLAKNLVDFPVHVIDTRQVSWALGHAALAGAEEDRVLYPHAPHEPPDLLDQLFSRYPASIHSKASCASATASRASSGSNASEGGPPAAST